MGVGAGFLLLKYPGLPPTPEGGFKVGEQAIKKQVPPTRTHSSSAGPRSCSWSIPTAARRRTMSSSGRRPPSPSPHLTQRPWASAPSISRVTLPGRVTSPRTGRRGGQGVRSLWPPRTHQEAYLTRGICPVPPYTTSSTSSDISSSTGTSPFSCGSFVIPLVKHVTRPSPGRSATETVDRLISCADPALPPPLCRFSPKNPNRARNGQERPEIARTFQVQA